MDQVFTRVIFITHVSWPIRYLGNRPAASTERHAPSRVPSLPKMKRRTPAQISEFIERKLMPVVDQAQREKNPKTLFILVKSPWLTTASTEELQKVADITGTGKIEELEPKKFREFLKSVRSLKRKLNKDSTARTRKADAIEDDLEKMLMEKVGDRLVVVQERSIEGAETIAKKVVQKVKKEGFKISEFAELERFGAWRDQCAFSYPTFFRSFMGGKNWQMRETARRTTIPFAPRRGNFKEKPKGRIGRKMVA